jgi:hypothetical protein
MAGYIALLITLIFVESFCLARPQGIRWSTTSYGPDGPWWAVQLTIGTPPQPIELLPGGTWASNILTSTICANATLSPVCYAKTAGLYNASASSTHWHSGSPAHVDNGPFDGNVGALPLFGTMEFGFDTASVPSSGFEPDVTSVVQSFDMIQISDAHDTLPDGTQYPITIGKMGLGGQNINQTWPELNAPNTNGTFITGSLYEKGEVQSNSFGMHIGSVTAGIPGSLYIGGYDQSRIVGPVTAQRYGAFFLPIDLLDIGFDVAEGQFPFNFQAKTGLLSQGNSSIGLKLPVQVDASLPYMYLPQSTCDAITKDLPVIYQPKYGLYFWNTTDPRYKMVSSPSMLTFTFRLNGGNAQSITINVPFPRLNLTLAPPITTSPTPYFPCRPTNGNYTLGRAFLQAAFLGANWGTDSKGVWFLAQAPGPNTPSQPVNLDIGFADKTLTPSTNEWRDSWIGGWTAIGTVTPRPTATGSTPSTNPTSSSSPSSSSSGFSPSPTVLSTGAIAGIAVGSTLAILLVLGLAFHFWRKRSTKATSEVVPTPRYSDMQHFAEMERDRKYGQSGYGPRELTVEREAVEMGTEIYNGVPRTFVTGNGRQVVEC